MLRVRVRELIKTCVTVMTRVSKEMGNGEKEKGSVKGRGQI